MLSLQYFSINNEFHYPFTISKGTKTHQPALVVKLGFGNMAGYGEAPAITYYNTTVEGMITLLESKRKFIESYSLIDPERFWHFLHHLFPENNFLVCALDMAAWDLWGKLKNKSIAHLIGVAMNQPITTDYTIGIDTTEAMQAKMKANPWPIYKIKCGTFEDVEKIKALRSITTSPFRLDANAGWSIADAQKILLQLETLGIELVEQPLAKDNWEGMTALRETFAEVIFMADEACVTEHDVLPCAKCFNGINIKLTKCGGITPALRMIKQARQLELRIMLGCMNETSIGSAAMAQLALLVDYIDMDGPLLLKTDTATGLVYNNGLVTIDFNKPGLSISVHENLFIN
jgi:L-Ala-D/L-Glu epimerase